MERLFNRLLVGVSGKTEGTEPENVEASSEETPESAE